MLTPYLPKPTGPGEDGYALGLTSLLLHLTDTSYEVEEAIVRQCGISLPEQLLDWVAASMADTGLLFLLIWVIGVSHHSQPAVLELPKKETPG